METFLSVVNAKIADDGVSMSELARNAGVGRSYLYRVLNGTQTPSLAIAERIAEQLGLEFHIFEKTG